ncbi:hypothetical protein HPB52_015570 [Rhipicephalus sanguineus]|uniref:Myb/SANT-like DNA-binding domain-containing protein 3 n=1 Tax=Rhipicephalus sanguineus TaxID=34632 RepID=A0A9D4PHE0_RHISA|nr:hypothetical protein HPB52_015570 [Rhipicephalus sanguineus]
MPAKTPFSEDEKDLIQDLVLKYKTAIENKHTDAISINAKAKAREKLCTEFNSRPFVRPRDVKQLKKLWDNMKQRWKREKAKQIHDVLTTGRRCYEFWGICRRRPLTTAYGRKARADRSHRSAPSARVTNPFDSDRPLATPAAQSTSEILNGMICENGPAGSDDGMSPSANSIARPRR